MILFRGFAHIARRGGYKGWDPYDRLNSKVFQALPLLKKSALCRLAVIQGFKRCPVNLRPLAVVPKERNAKGIGLFLQGYCNLYKLVEGQKLKVEGLGIERGFRYYIENFFEQDGSPKYYHNKKYPIDIHCPGQLFVSLSRLHKFDEYRPFADKVMNWTILNMQDKKGYFYYQLKPGISSKISYIQERSLSSVYRARIHFP